MTINEKKHRIEDNSIEIEEIKERKKLGLSKNNNSIDISDDFNSNESSYNSFSFNFEHPSKEFDILLKYFMSPLKKLNEIDYFQETIIKLKHQKKQIYDNLIHEMSEKTKETFNKILTLKRIDDLSGKKIDFRKILKVKGKKKINNQENSDMEYKESLYFDY